MHPNSGPELTSNEWTRYLIGSGLFANDVISGPVETFLLIRNYPNFMEMLSNDNILFML